MKNLSALKASALAVGTFLVCACAPSSRLKKVDDLYCFDSVCAQNYESICGCIEDKNYTIGGLYSEKGVYPIKTEDVELRCPDAKPITYLRMSFDGPIEKIAEKEDGGTIKLENTAAFEQSKNFCITDSDDDDDD